MDLVHHIAHTGWVTLFDVLPIAAILLFFQVFVLRRVPPKPKRIAVGFGYVVVGLTLFLVGLEMALFPLGKTMAEQLTAPQFLGGDALLGKVNWLDYMWVYIFAASIGFATTVAEPALIAVALKAEQISGGAIHARGLRLAVALGVAVGVSLGSYRIVSGTPLHWYIIVGYIVVIIQTAWASKFIVALAYDSGGVTTSTVTVPVVTALGLGLASTIPGRSPLLDGFGLIAFASLFPIMAVLAYANLAEWLLRRKVAKDQTGEKDKNYEPQTDNGTR
ncbi:hypothetical protein BEN30_04285 [Magnetovibrio blakemorei]|uniref:DUF1538 domain-containing protein n=2 Tax=Magnetovibrio blakemorei TaxID=28181 RepID=A0A1E5QBG6_9PROT|nr:hypothetical protein BEN30_04285 [Magnetovibrio blakemorei]